MKHSERLDCLAKHADYFSPFTGKFDRDDLANAWNRELGDETIRLPESIVHVISGNTPHALYQSLLYGLIVGAKNRLKLPSGALPDFVPPQDFAPLVEISRDLPDEWLRAADVLVVYGSDATVRHFRNLCPLETTFIGHGPRLGIALIDDPSPMAAELAAKDIGMFDQMGCLSLQTIFVNDPEQFAQFLTEAMTAYEKENPQAELSKSEAGAITNLRAETAYLQAQQPEKFALFQSDEDLSWTVIVDQTADIKLSPGNRTVFIKPMDTFRKDHPAWKNLSGIGIFPYQLRLDLPSPRIFPLGQAQTPPALWAHDGILPLASLAKHQTITKNS